MSREVGRIIRSARKREGLSQARLAELAGMSRRQLASIENGANTSLRVADRLAEVLRIEELPLGRATARAQLPIGMDAAILTDRAASAEAAVRDAEAALSHLRSALESRSTAPGADVIADSASDDEDLVHVPVMAELTPGKPLQWAKEVELIAIERWTIETGEALLRLRTGKEAEGLRDGDLLVIELRPAGNAATGEMVVALIGDEALVGRWWNKQNRRLLRAPRSGAVLREFVKGESFVLLGAVTHVIRSRRK